MSMFLSPLLRRYLLHLPGHGYSARLKYLLLCGSPVIYYDNHMDEFYYHILEVGLLISAYTQMHK